MQAAIVDERMGPDPALARRVKVTAIAVPTIVALAGAVAAIDHPAFILLAAAVVFGWSQLAGA